LSVSDHDPSDIDRPLPAELVGYAPSTDLVQAELAEESPPAVPQRRPRRVVLPIALFLLTCVSTFFVGVTGWRPDLYLSFDVRTIGADADPYFLVPARRAILANWQNGLLYMGCVLAILMTHEMGHFVMTLIYRVRASLPYFVPLPISPIGTMGAVIGMDGSQANRRQIFDIGLAGPLAGLIVAIPIIWIGATRLDLKHAEKDTITMELPVAMRLAVDHLHPGEYNPRTGMPFSALNPFFMAGWVGLLVTGLNMMPVSQLDGGHVLYALFGRRAHWLARGFMLVVFVYMVVMGIFYGMPPTWLLMAILVLLMGTDHPPTRDDTVQLGWFRTILGAASLAIPIFCFTPNPLH